MSFNIIRPISSTMTINPANEFDEQAKAELLVIIHNYLNSELNYHEIANLLKDYIDKNQVH